MRQVVLDTETTGLEWNDGHRVIEIGCVELVGRRITGETWSRYLNPGRDISAGATHVHGIRLEDLAEQPSFTEIADDLLGFLRDSELVIHNAEFDLAFLDAELRLAGRSDSITDHCQGVVDTLALARARYPGQRNSLEMLCKRYTVDASARERHGALLDAKLLAQVYLAMTSGQVNLLLGGAGADGTVAHNRRFEGEPTALRVIQPDAEECAAHERRLQALRQAAGGRCVWDRGS